VRGIKYSLNHGIMQILASMIRPAQLFNPTFASANHSGEFFHPYFEKHFVETISYHKFTFSSSIKGSVVVGKTRIDYPVDSELFFIFGKPKDCYFNAHLMHRGIISYLCFFVFSNCIQDILEIWLG
jgi:hypothetical protein